MSDTDSRRNTVLIVDDQPEIRRMATTALSMAGLEAQVAADGAEGLECFVEHRAEICLVVSDVVMPVMDGLSMAERILELEPATKILMMSAYSNVALEIKARERFAFIRKPFLPEQFIGTVRQMVDAAE